jgi:hypothetical protein
MPRVSWTVLEGGAGALLLLALAAPVPADEIVAASGVVTRDVKVVEQTAERVVFLDKSLKRNTFPASIVKSVVRKRSSVHEYEERLAAAKDADAVLALAEWASKGGFAKAVVRALHARALQLDPDHAEANAALGRVRHEGRWMAPEERDRLVREAEEAAMRARGLVRHGDRWVSPEEKENLEKGLRLHEGRWLTEEEIREKEGYVRHEGRWVKREALEAETILGFARKATGLGDELRLRATEHYAVVGDLTETELQGLADAMERLYDEWLRLFPDTPEGSLLPGKHRIYAFRKSPPYASLVRALHEEHRRTAGWSDAFAREEEERMKLRQRETSFWLVDPEILSGHVQMPDPYEGLRAHCVHFGANVLGVRTARVRFLSWWLLEGLAYYMEKRVTGGIQTFNTGVGGGGYAGAGPREHNKGDPWLDGGRWPQLLLSLVHQGRDPPLDAIRGKDLFSERNRLAMPDLAKAWSVVTWLLEDDARKFAAFFVEAKTGEGGGAEEREVAAVLRHYGSYQKLDEGWRAYVRNDFRVVR